MSGQMFSFRGQKAGLGKGAVPEARPDNEPLPTQATPGPDPPRRQQGRPGWQRHGGLPLGQRCSLGSSRDPGTGRDEPSLAGRDGGGLPERAIAGEPCSWADVAEAEVASFPPPNMHAPHNHEGPNHLFIKIPESPGPKHKPAMTVGGLGKQQRVKLPNPRPRFSMYPLKLMNLCQG